MNLDKILTIGVPVYNTEKYLDIKVAVLVKKKTAKITHYQVSLDEIKHCLK